eukprot:GHVU01164973.1.p2 GENE.GHVU01164973.1~~GHVU01164973.1.p2  ORF type:complete len:118 (-),score=35.41 GHVU01164973.1:588-941(-)
MTADSIAQGLGVHLGLASVRPPEVGVLSLLPSTMHAVSQYLVLPAEPAEKESVGFWQKLFGSKAAEKVEKVEKVEKEQEAKVPKEPKEEAKEEAKEKKSEDASPKKRKLNNNNNINK